MYSKIAILIIVLFSIILRLSVSPLTDKQINLFNYDAFGYYVYLPSIFIYNDYKELKWLEEIDRQYKVTGTNLYQANKAKNGNYVFKYFCGVSILQSPFFLFANSIAENTGYPKDGFSMPYQIAIVFSSLFYFLLGLIFLRKSLINYFKDSIVFFVLISVTIATNLPQYVSIECSMTHTYLFFIYCLIIYLTDQVHQSPSRLNTFCLGLFCGLAIVTRPTEAICILIPILWKPKFDLDGLSKFEYLKTNLQFILLPIIAGSIILSAQIVYWKLSSGDLIYNVGSKWVFLNPYFRVLFGFEKGWFIYTPVAIFFILGLFKLGKSPFNKSIMAFTLLNIWIIISWFDWRYGASYSTRALTHSYPVFALSLGCLLASIKNKKIFFLYTITLISFIVINTFQLFQYNNEVLHYNDMNRKYYNQIFLNTNPMPLDFSLLDTQDWVNKNTITGHNLIFKSKEFIDLNNEKLFKKIILHDDFQGHFIQSKLDLNAMNSFWDGKLLVKVLSQDEIIKTQTFRLSRPLASFGTQNRYEFYTSIPESCTNCTISYNLESLIPSKAWINYFEINHIELKQI